MRAKVIAVLVITAAFGALASADGQTEVTATNDNRTPAGSLRGNVLTLRLEARMGMWHPNGDDAAGATIPAFGEAGRALQIPGPLIRVRAGTEVDVSVRNRLADTLLVRGLYDRAGKPVPASAQVGERLAPGERRALRIHLETPGTYYYWGTTTRREINFRTREDAQLTGAIVVDPADRAPEADRILVIGMWADTVARAYVERHRILGVVNGRSWPFTERLRYAVGDTVRWRVINATGDNHPMHLHGFYFRVDSRGDGRGDTTYREDARDRVVTEPMSPGTTMQITWVPERAGNWLFHCHIPEHFSKRGALGMPPEPAGHTSTGHATGDMGGLIVGIQVAPDPSKPTEAQRDAKVSRHLRLLVRRNAGGSDDMPYFGFTLQDSANASAPADSGLHLGPPIVLTRGERVSIMVVNQLAEATSVHWHGIELESYYDGVAGWSGSAAHLAPAIAPRDSFDARFTPPRAGTFIYHTHVDELRQQPAGLSGPIIVLEPGETWDSLTDHAVMITSPASFEAGRNAVLVNGSRTAPPLVVRAGVPQRLRIINMTTRRPALRLELRRDTTLLAWRQLGKDGADLPEPRRAQRSAVRLISIGETLDVLFTPDAPGDIRLDVVLGGVALTVHPVLGTLPIHVDAGPGGR